MRGFTGQVYLFGIGGEEPFKMLLFKSDQPTRTLSSFRGKYGCGIFNGVLNALPFELHYPFGDYKFLGPGTKLEQRLARGDQPYNKLDEAARNHDIAYGESNNLADRHKADIILEKEAWDRVKSSDASLGERIAGYVTTNAIKLKRKLGMGCRTQSSKKWKTTSPLRKQREKVGVCGCGLSFAKLIKKQTAAKMKAVKAKKKQDITDETLRDVASNCLAAIKLPQEANWRKRKVPRIIPIPKTGGALPLIPIVAGISSLGSLVGGVNAVVKAVRDIIEAKKLVANGEKQKIGEGMFLTPYKKGYGISLPSMEVKKKKLP